MASRWTDVERVEQGALPTMLAQAVIAGTALTVGAIACSGFYLSMIGNVAALLPWATIVILIAVAFTYIVGFALLWCGSYWPSSVSSYWSCCSPHCLTD